MATKVIREISTGNNTKDRGCVSVYPDGGRVCICIRKEGQASSTLFAFDKHDAYEIGQAIQICALEFGGGL